METMVEKLVANQPTGIRSGSRNRIQKIYLIDNWYEESAVAPDPQLLFLAN